MRTDAEIRLCESGAALTELATDAPECEPSYRALFENLNEGVVHGKVLFEATEPYDLEFAGCNRRFSELTGWGEVAGKRLSQLVANLAEWRSPLLEALGRAASTGLGEQFDFHLPGQNCWFSLSAHGDGKAGFAAVCQDISDRRRVENALCALLGSEGRGQGEVFFQSLARLLAETLAFDAVLIERLTPDGASSFPVARYADGVFQSGVERSLAGTLRGAVAGGAWPGCSPQARELFPQDEDVAATKAESSAGARIVSSTGATIGVIVALGRKALTHPALTETLLRLAAVRAAGEMERAESEHALRHCEQRFRDIVEAASDWIWEVDAQGRYTYASPRVLDLLGYSPEQLTGKTVFDFMPPDEAVRVRAEFETMGGGRRPFRTLKNLSVHRSGRLVAFESSGTPIIGSDGELVGYRGMARDISRQKRAEINQARQSGVTRVLAESSTLAEAAPRILQILCDGRTDESGMLWRRLAQPGALSCAGTWPAAEPSEADTEFAERVRGEAGVLRRASEDGEACEIGVPVTFGGEVTGVLHLRWRVPPSDVEEQVESLAAIGILIGQFTERQRAQEDLRRFVSASPTVIYALEAEGDQRRVVWVSDNIETMTGYTPDEALTPGWFESCVHPDDLPRVRGPQRNVTTGPLEYRVRRKDGSVFWVRDEKRAVERDGRRVVVGSWSDVTDRVQLEQQLQRAQRLESIGRLAGGVAHDFNNLLTVINGYAGLLAQAAPDDEQVRSGIEEIAKAGGRAAELTRKLLAFGRKQPPQPKLLELNEQLRGMERMLVRLIGEDVRLTLELDAAPAPVYADASQLEQVVMNLVVNARDAMPFGGVIRLSVRIQGGSPGFEAESPGRRKDGRRWVVIAVSDTGTGMDESTKARVFEPFFTTKESGKGTGLGLSTVDGVVAQCGGHIEVDTQPGGGSTFRVFLPMAEGTESQTPAPAVKETARGNESILVVEDQDDVRKFAAAALRSFGYQVRDAATPHDAIAVCEGGAKIDLLLTDVVMPELSGPELAARLRSMRPGLEILYMSGYADTRLRGKCQDSGGQDPGACQLIEKPFQPEELARRVRKILGDPRKQARILIADDERSLRDFFRHVLERAGFEVVSAEDGKSAVTAALSNEIDLAVVDLIMPEQDGIETISILRKRKPRLPIIAISGYVGGELLAAAQHLGADEILAKPVEPQTLMETVRKMLAGRGALRINRM